MAKKSLGLSLGNVLEDVLSEHDSEFNSVFYKDLDAVKEIDICDISPNPYQPRKHFDQDSITELANSIKNHGLLQPIILVDADDLCNKAKENGENIKKITQYFLIAGERRLRAVKLLGEAKIRAIIANIDSSKSRELALLENIQREDLNPIELALAYKELIDVRKITQDELAKSIQKSRASITNTLRLLTLNEDTQRLIIEGKLSVGHAKIIAGQKQDEDLLVKSVIGQKLNVRDCEKLANKLKNNKKDNVFELDEDILTIIKKLNIDYKMSKNGIFFNLRDTKTKDFLINLIKNF